MKQEYPCRGFGMEDVHQAREHMRLEIVEDYGDRCNERILHVGDEGRRYLARCTRCGGLVLVQQSEAHYIDDDDDYLDFYPVSSAEEASILNQTYDGYDIELCFPKRYIKSTNGRLSWGAKLNRPYN